MSLDFIRNSPELAPASATQSHAQDTQVSVWVAASAGAGKTRVLTARMMRLLIEGSDPGAILALTYTKAAAKEMASRLITEARQLALGGHEGLPEQVAAILQRAPAPDELERARTLYERILEAPGGLQIQTIHAFCQSLLGRFPFEAGLTPGFKAIEDDERSQILAQASAKVLSQNPAAFGQLKAMVQGDKLTDLVGVMVKIDWEALGASARLVALDAALGGGLINGSAAAIRETFNSWFRSRIDALSILRNDAFSAGNKSDLGLAEHLSTALTSQDPYTALIAHYLTGDRVPKKVSSIATKAVKKHPLYEPLYEQIVYIFERLLAQGLFDLNKDILAFGEAVSATFSMEKARLGALDFDDLIHRAGQLLRTDQGPSYVQYRLDQRIDHILVDEAQDTSTAQWAVIAGLADPFFDDDSGMADRQRTLFVVGDFKQSIYSFQGANPHLFQQKREQFSALGTDRLRSVSMVHSFRSAPPILSFVDRVSARLEAGGLAGSQDGIPAHLAVQQGRAGRVEVWPVPAEKDQKPKVDWQPLRQVATRATRRATLGRVIARHIHRLCFSADYAARPDAYLRGAGRRLQPGDFLILLQNRRPEFADALIGELKRLNVPVTGVDRVRLSKELLVQDLLALADICLQPGDDLALASVLKSPLYGWTEDALFALAHDRGTSSLMGSLAVQDPGLAAHFDALAAGVGQLSVYEFYARALFADGMRARALAHLGPEAEEVMSLFLDRCRTFDQRANGDLLGFVEGERGGQQDLKRDTSESKGEVRMMTVHGAKGLEAPFVILPDLSDPSLSGGGQRASDQVLNLRGGEPVWVPTKAFDVEQTTAAKAAEKVSQAEEKERLLYVALTRAEERLLICSDDAGRPWHTLAQAVARDVGEEQDFELEGLGWAVSQGYVFGKIDDVPESVAGVSQLNDPSPLPAWVGISPPAPEKTQKRLTPSALGETGPTEAVLAPSNRAQALQRGTLIHAALEHLPTVPQAQWSARLDTFFELKAPEVEKIERHSWTQEVMQALENPELAAFFSPQSRAEVTLTGPIGTQTAVGQIDRLVIDAAAGEVMILDYKTNRPPPKDVASVSPAYRAQLQAYARLVAPLYPDFAVRTFLFWTHTCTLMDVTDQ